jgi:hypothetical protein
MYVHNEFYFSVRGMEIKLKHLIKLHRSKKKTKLLYYLSDQ